MKAHPRVINEFEGGPSHVYWGKHPFITRERKQDDFRHFVFWGIRDHQILRDLKLSITEEAISWEKMPLVTECEECEECNANTCPKPIEEVQEKGSGMKVVEVLEGWFIDLGKCTPWKLCECCHGKGYFESK